MTPLEIYHRKRVCSIHFTDDSLSPGTSKLKRNALPTLHMPLDYSASCIVTFNAPSSYSLFDDDIFGIENLPSMEQHLDESLKDVTNTLSLLSKIGVKRKSSLIPKCKLFYSEALRLKKNLLRCHSASSSFKKRLKFAKQFPDEVIMNKIAQKVTSVLSLFSNLQPRETKKKPRGRRFTLNEKMLSLSLFKKSPKSFKLLSKLFTLPSSRTLNSLLSTVKLKAGINPNLMKM